MITKRTRLSGWIAPLLFSFANAFAANDPTIKTISYILDFEPPQLNSMKSTDTVSSFVLGHLMEGLTRYGKTGEILPGVAERWKISDHGADFFLRKDAKWSDGNPVTAKDFIFAWKTALDPKTASEYAFILYPIKNAELINRGKTSGDQLAATAIDDYHIQIKFEKPCGYFLTLTALPTYFPIREDFFQKHKDRYAADVQDLLFNGPFLMTRWVHGASLQMDKNPTYWDSQRIALDRINIPYITSDDSARFNFFRDGKSDILESLTREALQKAQAEQFRMKSFAEGSLWYLEFNFRPGRPTTNKNLRKAIQAVFDPVEFANKVMAIPGTKAASWLIPSWMRGVNTLFRKEFPIADLKPNLEKAKEYLAVAKKELGVSTIPPLVLLADDKPQGNKESEFLQQHLKRTLGLDIKIDKQIFKQRLAKMTAGQFDIVNAGWGPDYPDPMTFAELKASWNENNRGKFSNPDYDKYIRQAQSTANPAERMQAMAKAEAIGIEEVAILPTYERVKIYVHSDRIQGIIRHPIGPDPDFTFSKVVRQP